MILQVCQEQDYSFRKRVLGPVETLIAFCVQILHENTACNSLRHWLGIDVTDSAYCQARQRLPVQIFKTLLYRLTKSHHTEVVVYFVVFGTINNAMEDIGGFKW